MTREIFDFLYYFFLLTQKYANAAAIDTLRVGSH